MPDKPNPGSEEAISQGCKCPVLDNGRGRGYMGQPGTFVYSSACPIHWTQEIQKQVDEAYPDDR